MFKSPLYAVFMALFVYNCPYNNRKLCLDKDLNVHLSK